MNSETMLKHQQEHKSTIHALREKYHRPEESRAENAITVIVSTTTTGLQPSERPKKAVVFVDGIVHCPKHVDGLNDIGWLLTSTWLYSSSLQVLLSHVWSSRIKSETVKGWPAIAALSHPNKTNDIRRRDLKTPVVSVSECSRTEIRYGSLTISIDGNSISADNDPADLHEFRFRPIQGESIVPFRDEVVLDSSPSICVRI